MATRKFKTNIRWRYPSMGQYCTGIQEMACKLGWWRKLRSSVTEKKETKMLCLRGDGQKEQVLGRNQGKWVIIETSYLGCYPDSEVYGQNSVPSSGSSEWNLVFQGTAKRRKNENVVRSMTALICWVFFFYLKDLSLLEMKPWTEDSLVSMCL